MTFFVRFWKETSITAKLAMAAVVVGLLFAVWNVAGAWNSRRLSAAADKKVAAKQVEIDKLQAERDEWTVERARLLGNADQEHVAGELADAKEAATKALIAQQGTAVRDTELKKVEQINEDLKRDQAVTSADISDAERCVRIRAKYLAAGIPYQCRP